MKRNLSPLVGAVLIGAYLAFAPLRAFADPLIHRVDFPNAKNDCVGYFGPNPNDPDEKPNGKAYTGFSACWVQAVIGDTLTYLSPSIIKFDWTDDGLKVGEISDRYPTVSGGEFSFTGLDSGGTGLSGTWNYKPDPMVDPGILYWTAKAGDGFSLWWYGEASIASAIAVTSGPWQTLENKELSHLTFYNSGGEIAPPPDPPAGIPEPGTLLLLGGAFAALGLRRRYRR